MGNRRSMQNKPGDGDDPLCVGSMAFQGCQLALAKQTEVDKQSSKKIFSVAQQEESAQVQVHYHRRRFGNKKQIRATDDQILITYYFCFFLFKSFSKKLDQKQL